MSPGLYQIPRLDAGAPIIDPVFHVPYGCGANSYFGHIVEVIWVWINLTLLLLVKYAPARGRFALRRRKRLVRHWISTRFGDMTALGSDEDDEAWLRRMNRELMDELRVFNQNHVYSLTHDPKTFVRVPCLPEFEADGYDTRGCDDGARRGRREAGQEDERDELQEGDQEEGQEELVENQLARWVELGDAHGDEHISDETDDDAKVALALDDQTVVHDRTDEGEYHSTDDN